MSGEEIVLSGKAAVAKWCGMLGLLYSNQSGERVLEEKCDHVIIPSLNLESTSSLCKQLEKLCPLQEHVHTVHASLPFAFYEVLRKMILLPT